MQRVESMPSHLSWKWAYTKIKLYNSRIPLIDPPSILFRGWFLTVWFPFIFSVLVKWKQSVEERQHTHFSYRCSLFDQWNENGIWLDRSRPAVCPANTVQNAWGSTDILPGIMAEAPCGSKRVSITLQNSVPYRAWLALLTAYSRASRRQCPTWVRCFGHVFFLLPVLRQEHHHH